MTRAIPCEPVSPFMNPTNLSIAMTSVLSTNAKYIVRLIATNPSLALTVPSSRSHLIQNEGGYSVTIATTGNATFSLAPGQECRCTWDTSQTKHEVQIGPSSTAIDNAMSGVSTNAVQNAVIKAYVDASVAALDSPIVGLKTIARYNADGSLAEEYSLAAATTSALRGAALVTALNELTSGQTIAFLGVADFDVNDYTLTSKNRCGIYMPRATWRRPNSSTGSQMFRLHRASHNVIILGKLDINADGQPATTRDVGVSFGGGIGNELYVDTVCGHRRSWAPWNNATAYAVGDGCYYAATGVANMEWFYALNAHTNSEPYVGNANWNYKSTGAIEVDSYNLWLTGTTYSLDQIVWYGDDYWRATGAIGANIAPGEGVSNWVRAGDYAPYDTVIELRYMHNPGPKGLKLGGENTTLQNFSISQDSANDYAEVQSHDAFDYWGSCGRFNVVNGKLHNLTCEAGTSSNKIEQYNIRNGLSIRFDEPRGALNTTTFKVQYTGLFHAQGLSIRNHNETQRPSFRTHVESTRAIIEDSDFSGWIGIAGDTTLRRCRVGTKAYAYSSLFYQLTDTERLTLDDVELVNATYAINCAGGNEDIFVKLDDVRCTSITYLLSDFRRLDRLTARKVSGYTNLCYQSQGLAAALAKEGLDPNQMYGSAAPTGGYATKGMVVWNTGGGATKYWICTTAGYCVIGAAPANTAVLRGEWYDIGGQAYTVTAGGVSGNPTPNVGGTATWSAAVGAVAVWTAV